MWSKIKARLPQVPITVKLTALYALILFAILVLTSVMTLSGVRYYLNTQSKKDIDTSFYNITQYLAAGNPIDQQLLRQDLLPPDTGLRIYDEQGALLLDSAPFIPPADHEAFDKNKKAEHDDFDKLHEQDSKRRQLPHKIHGGDYYAVEQQIAVDNRRYTVQIIRSSAGETLFIRTLTLGLGATGLIGIAIAIAAGLYLSRKVLQPLRSITETAKQIQVKNLDQRLTLRQTRDELDELADTFNHMLTRIQTGFEQQRRFVSDASHELRTPITVISGYTDMLDRWGKHDAAVLDESLAAIKSEVANMHGLIEKLLFLARADQGQQVVKKEVLATAPFLEEIVRETILIATQHTIELGDNEPATILADSTFLKQMLRIFLENSIKYTPSGGIIRLAARHTGQAIALSVQDTGIGIDAAEQAKIFERFYRVDKSRTKATGGNGLGLAIAHWIAEQHGSTITIASAPEQGTTITVAFPVI